MSWNKDPYRILGVTSDATIEDIKSAYRLMARRLHPDTNPNNAAAAGQFQDVTTAHELLTNPSRRRTYDDNMQRLRKNSKNLYYSLQTILSKRIVVPMPEPQVMYYLLNITPDARAVEQTKKDSNNNSRMNLTLVLDQSNSMNGARIEKVKVAAHQIIDNLSHEDVLSVVSFNDRPSVIIDATLVKDKPALKTKVSLINASGSTEIYQGLVAGLAEARKFLDPKMVNHIILLTDGHTFGDEKKCLELASNAAKEGIGISAMGLGHDWNDKFLDELASKTGGTSSHVTSAAAVVRFLNDHVRSLSNSFAERLQLSVATDADVRLESAFKLAPNPQPLDVENGIIPLGTLQHGRLVSILLQFQLPSNMEEGTRSVARLAVSGDILANTPVEFTEIVDPTVEVNNRPPREEPPTQILDALSKLTLYRLQERAEEALQTGNVDEATRRLENLATRLLELGKKELASQALSEAKRVAHTSALSQKGRMTLKYQTRHLLTDGDADMPPIDD